MPSVRRQRPNVRTRALGPHSDRLRPARSGRLRLATPQSVAHNRRPTLPCVFQGLAFGAEAEKMGGVSLLCETVSTREPLGERAMPNSLIIVMPIAIAILVGAFSVVVFASRLGTISRVIAALVLVLLWLFCVYGFAATFEPLDRDVQITWRILYSAVGLACLVGVARLMLAGKRST